MLETAFVEEWGKVHPCWENGVCSVPHLTEFDVEGSTLEWRVQNWGLRYSVFNVFLLKFKKHVFYLFFLFFFVFF